MAGAFQEDYGYERQPGDVTEPPLLEQIYDGVPSLAYEMHPAVAAKNIAGAFGNIATGQGGAGDYAEAGLAAAGTTPAGKLAAFLALPAIKRLTKAGMGHKAVGQFDSHDAAREAMKKGATPEQMWNEFGWAPPSAWGAQNWQGPLVTYADTPFRMTDEARGAFQAASEAAPSLGGSAHVLRPDGREFRLGEAFDAPEFYAAYPEARQMFLGDGQGVRSFSAISRPELFGGMAEADFNGPFNVAAQSMTPRQAEQIITHEADHLASYYDQPISSGPMQGMFYMSQQNQDLMSPALTEAKSARPMNIEKLMNARDISNVVSAPYELRAREAAARQYNLGGDIDAQEMLVPGQVNTMTQNAWSGLPKEEIERQKRYLYEGLK